MDHVDEHLPWSASQQMRFCHKARQLLNGVKDADDQEEQNRRCVMAVAFLQLLMEQHDQQNLIRG